MHCCPCSSRFVVPVSAVSPGAARSSLSGSEHCAFSTVRVRQQAGALFAKRIRESRPAAPPVIPAFGVRAVGVSVAGGSGITTSGVGAVGLKAVPLSTLSLRGQRVNYSLSSLLPAQYRYPMHLGNLQGAASRRAWPNITLERTVRLWRPASQRSRSALSQRVERE